MKQMEANIFSIMHKETKNGYVFWVWRLPGRNDELKTDEM